VFLACTEQITQIQKKRYLQANPFHEEQFNQASTGALGKSKNGKRKQ